MADLYLVTNVPGPAWDPARRLREQRGWDEHAAFMDALADEGFVLLGGPVGDPDDHDHVLLVIDAPDEAAIRARLGDDPWQGGTIEIARIDPWSVWLRGPRGRQ
jgi:uncharacterized protein YciI